MGVGRQVGSRWRDRVLGSQGSSRLPGGFESRGRWRCLPVSAVQRVRGGGCQAWGVV